MASSRNSAPADGSAVLAALGAALNEHMPPAASIAVALSGGIDSMVLLDALVPLARQRDSVVTAVHVDHGISPNSAQWAAFCAEQCALRDVALVTHRLALGGVRRNNLEAITRRARYDALRTSRADVVALAHHADDQAETVLLQLLRGAGPRGLAAMPRFQPGAPALWRPFLNVTRAALAACAAERNVAWIDDESNADVHYRRNVLRRDVASQLAQHFPGYPATLVRAARLQAEAAQLQDALAAADAAGAVTSAGLDCARLASLPPLRARNLLRWFLRAHGLRSPTETRLGEMLRQFVAPRADARTCIAHDGVEIGCHRGIVVVHAPSPAAFAHVWHGEAQVTLPGGTLTFEPARGSGIAEEKLAARPVTLRSRAGGERMQLATDRPRRALKKLLQDADVPAWERQALPLVWCGDRLAAVPGVGVDLAFHAAPDENGWALRWESAERHGGPAD